MISTVLLVGAIVSTSWKTASIELLLPMMFENWMRRLQRLLEQDVLLLQPLALQLAPDAQAHFARGARRLVDVVGGAEPQRFDRGVGRGERRHHDADDVGSDALGLAQQLDPVHVAASGCR